MKICFAQDKCQLIVWDATPHAPRVLRVLDASRKNKFNYGVEWSRDGKRVFVGSFGDSGEGMRVFNVDLGALELTVGDGYQSRLVACGAATVCDSKFVLELGL